MTLNEIQTTEEIPIVKKLHNRIERGRNFLKRRPRTVKSWIGGVRTQLKKLYGPTSEAMDLFPLIKNKFSKKKNYRCGDR